MKFLFLILLQILSASFCLAETFSGRVLSRGFKRPLASAQILILNHRLKAESSKKGDFEIKDVPAGALQIRIQMPGYEALELELSQPEEKRDFYLKIEEQASFETTVRAQKKPRDVVQRTLKQEEFLALPGAGGDPVKAVQNLPGVNRVGGFSSQVVIQGSSPQDTGYLMDGHSIPDVFHFGGFTSVVMPEAIEQVDYLSAGYGAEYSGALGGFVALKTREPDVEERDLKGFYFADTLKAGGLIEGKLSENQSLLASARISYIGAVLRQATKGSEDFDLTVAPEFADLTLIHNYKVSDNEYFKTSMVYARDRLEFLLKEPLKTDPALRGGFSNLREFVRFIPQWKKKISSDLQYSMSAGLGYQTNEVEIGSNYFRNRFWTGTFRGEQESRINEAWKTRLGYDFETYSAKVDLRLPLIRNEGGVVSPLAGSEVREVSVTAKPLFAGFYWQNEVKTSDRVTHTPSLRFDYFSTTKESFLWPRYSVRAPFSESVDWKLASGIYSQSPEPREFVEEVGNSQIKSPRAFHLSLGLENDLNVGDPSRWSWQTQAFWKEMDRLVVNSNNVVNRNGSDRLEIYNNDGFGRAVGVELLLKHKSSDWESWIAYTLSKSTRWNKGQSANPSEFDQTHNLNLIYSYTGFKWKWSTRMRWVTGNPLTPVTGSIYDSNNDVYLPQRGDIYSERYRDFKQVDLRIDRKIILEKSLFSLYFDIQNVLLFKNVESVSYSYDYKKKEEINSFPILVAIGVKGEF